MVTVSPYKIDVPQEVIDDLWERFVYIAQGGLTKSLVLAGAEVAIFHI